MVKKYNNIKNVMRNVDAGDVATLDDLLVTIVAGVDFLDAHNAATEHADDFRRACAHYAAQLARFSESDYAGDDNVFRRRITQLENVLRHTAKHAHTDTDTHSHGSHGSGHSGSHFGLHHTAKGAQVRALALRENRAGHNVMIAGHAALHNTIVENLHGQIDTLLERVQAYFDTHKVENVNALRKKNKNTRNTYGVGVSLIRETLHYIKHTLETLHGRCAEHLELQQHCERIRHYLDETKQALHAYNTPHTKSESSFSFFG